MEDAVRPTIETRRAVFERGFRIWSSLYDIAKKETIIPESCFQVQETFANLPHFPPDLDLEEHHNNLYTKGRSVWSTKSSNESSFLEKSLDIPVSIASPTNLTLSSDQNLDYGSWFSCEDDHISVLVLAWAYVFSARWAELIPDSVLEYTDSQPTQNKSDQDALLVDIGNVSGDAARWWAAVLAPGEGWRAYISSDRAENYLSPWSILLQSTPGFKLSCHGSDDPISVKAISSATALRYLLEYCNIHNAMDQGYAALSAALMLPLSNSRMHHIHLPAPKLRKSTVLKSRKEIGHDWLQAPHSLDKLLVLGCNDKGVHSLLSSVFYDPNIACNAVSPWLQATFAILDSVGDSYHHLVHIMTRRVPHLGFLWLGGIITGVHSWILQEARFGMIPVELHAAMWTGTMQSFIQEATPQHSVVKSCISRAHECQLLFIMQKRYHTRWPICQWTPFGNTALEYTDISICSYARYFRYELKYLGWKWACKANKVVEHVCEEKGLVPNFPEPPQMSHLIPINYDALDLEEESASENATRSIFGWLRFEGYPANEKEIYSHEWFDLGDADDEDLCENSKASNIGNPSMAAGVKALIGNSVS